VRFTVRNYRPEDFSTLWKIDQGCFPPGIAYTQLELNSFIQHRGAFTLVAETSPGHELPEGRSNSGHDIPCILGFLVAESRRAAGHIVTIDVRPQARRHLVGSVLLEAAESRMRSHDCEVSRLETAVDNVAALSFYKRHGYSVIKVVPRYYSNGLDALVLEKNLLSSAPLR
jgi:[ribosomal protein S18]-alanine N-acetyltransferase